MKVGDFTVILRDMPFDQALDYLADLGVQTVEIGTGAYSGTDHCDAEELLASDAKAKPVVIKTGSFGCFFPTTVRNARGRLSNCYYIAP
jgi:sugar phosphate isomerase/epimerase